MLHKIALHLESQAPTPYREAILALRHDLEGARRGELPHSIASEDTSATATVAIGQRVPDFLVADLTGKESVRLTRLLGRPVFLFFYNPVTENGKEVLRFAQALHQRHGDKLSIMAMVVGTNSDAARKQHADWRLPFPVLDGNGLHQTFAVDATPRLVVLDREGMLRYATTGWGTQTPREVSEELARALTR